MLREQKKHSLVDLPFLLCYSLQSNLVLILRDFPKIRIKYFQRHFLLRFCLLRVKRAGWGGQIVQRDTMSQLNLISKIKWRENVYQTEIRMKAQHVNVPSENLHASEAFSPHKQTAKMIQLVIEYPFPFIFHELSLLVQLSISFFLYCHDGR